MMILTPVPSTCSACRKLRLRRRRPPQGKSLGTDFSVRREDFRTRRRHLRRRPTRRAAAAVATSASAGLALLLLTTGGMMMGGADGASFWFRSRQANVPTPAHLVGDPPMASQEDDGWEPPLTDQEGSGGGGSPSNDPNDEYAYPGTRSFSSASPATSFQRGNPPPPPPPPPRNPQSRGGPGGFGATSLTTNADADSPRRSAVASNYSPIHYEFKARDENDGGDPDDARYGRSSDRDGTQQGGGVETASARRDVVTRYMSRPSRALHLRFNAALVGAALGTFASRSLVASTAKSNPYTIPALCFVAFFVTSYFRNPYGELVRALGMTLILVLRQSRQIRKRYPGLRHLQSVLRIKPRAPFPPSRNIWSYQPREGTSDPEFSMLYSLVAMAMVGSLVGGNVPILPSWMGGLAGGAVFAFATTLPTPNGDLARCMGMRVVAVAQEAWILQSELRLLSKFGTVTGKIADKLLILDRKHRIKDRVVSGVSFLYEQVLRAAQQQQQPEPPPRGPPPRGRSDDPRDDEERRRPPQRPPPPRRSEAQGYDESPPSYDSDYRQRGYDGDRRRPPPNYNEEDGRGDFGR